MHPLILDNLEAIRALCRKFRVARLDVFGSVTTDAFDPDSSGVDFIVESPADYASGPVLSQYFELKNGLGERTIV